MVERRCADQSVDLVALDGCEVLVWIEPAEYEGGGTGKYVIALSDESQSVKIRCDDGNDAFAHPLRILVYSSGYRNHPNATVFVAFRKRRATPRCGLYRAGHQIAVQNLNALRAACGATGELKMCDACELASFRVRAGDS